MNIIIKPNQRINIIRNILVDKEIMLVAYVVSEKMIFYEIMSKLIESCQDFNFNEIKIP